MKNKKMKIEIVRDCRADARNDGGKLKEIRGAIEMKFFEHINKVNRAVILLGRNISQFNRQENEILTAEFKKRVIELKEQNSRDLYTFYYVPEAVRKLLKEKKVIDNCSLKATAAQLLIDDMAQGNIDELYLFQERVNNDKV